MRIWLLLALLISCLPLKAQFSKAQLQVGGMTCPMCSRAVKGALEKVRFVEGVMVDLNTLEYELVFKKNESVNLDQLRKAVEDAGFSIVSFKAMANFDGVRIGSDGLFELDNQTFCALNQSDMVLSGVRTVTIVGKNFMTAKAFKKYSASIQRYKDSTRIKYHILI